MITKTVAQLFDILQLTYVSPLGQNTQRLGLGVMRLGSHLGLTVF